MSADVQPLKRREQKLRHCLVMFADIETAPRKNWLVNGLLGSGDFSCVYGSPGAGKSVLVGDFAAHVAAGEQWFGRRVEHAAVLYVAAERAKVVERRLAAIRKHHGWDELPLGLIAGSFDLRNSRTDADEIITHAATLESKTKLPVRLIVIDTYNRTLNGGDENSSKDVGAFVANADYIQRTTGAHILIVHHVPHEQTRMRGHGALLAACDTTIRVQELSAARVAVLEKSNDTIEGAKLAFSLESVLLHRDENTCEETTAPIIVPRDGAVPEAQASAARKLSDRQKLALDALADCAVEQGAAPPAAFGLPNGLRCVKVTEWREEVFRKGVIDRDAANPREDFKRVKNALAARHLIGERDGFVWRAR